MTLIDDYRKKEEFESDRYCEFCNAQEGKLRMVGNFIVELSEIELDEETRLACQSCKIKHRNFEKAKQSAHRNNRSLLRKLFSYGHK